MGLIIKPGVKLAGMLPQAGVIMQIVEGIYDDYRLDCVVTSVMEGEHKRASAHHTGRAVDFRTHHIPTLDMKHEILALCRERAGAEFDFLFEAQGTPREHFHGEWDPKE